MQNAVQTVMGLLISLFMLLLGWAGKVQEFLRIELIGLGIEQNMQDLILVCTAALLALAALRLFGGVIGVLLTLFLLMVIAHVLAPTFIAHGKHS